MDFIAFRLYGNPGCPACEAAARKFIEAKVPALMIGVENDPIINEGIRAVTRDEETRVPVLVSFLNNPIEVIQGFKEGEYDRLLSLYRSRVGSVAPSVSTPEGQSAGETPQVGSEQAPTAGGTN